MLIDGEHLAVVELGKKKKLLRLVINETHSAVNVTHQPSKSKSHNSCIPIETNAAVT